MSYQSKRPLNFLNSKCQGIRLIIKAEATQEIGNIVFCRSTFFRSQFFRLAMKIGRLIVANLPRWWKCYGGECRLLLLTGSKKLFETWQENREASRALVHQNDFVDSWRFYFLFKIPKRKGSFKRRAVHHKTRTFNRGLMLHLNDEWILSYESGRKRSFELGSLLI
jgi:hypothetical protein